MYSEILRAIPAQAIGQDLPTVLQRFHVYGLIAKDPRTRRWRLTNKGLLCITARRNLSFTVWTILCLNYLRKLRRSYRQEIYSPIARRIVELHWGVLSAGNALEGGTVFGFDLPMQHPAAA